MSWYWSLLILKSSYCSLLLLCFHLWSVWEATASEDRYKWSMWARKGDKNTHRDGERARMCVSPPHHHSCWAAFLASLLVDRVCVCNSVCVCVFVEVGVSSWASWPLRVLRVATAPLFTAHPCWIKKNLFWSHTNSCWGHVQLLPWVRRLKTNLRGSRLITRRKGRR